MYSTHSQGAERSVAQQVNDDRLANFLGWFSIGLGVAEIAAPRAFSNFIGVKDKQRTRTLLRLYGLREIAAGVGILSRPRPAGWVWGRVAGDFLDLTSLASALNSTRNNKARLAASAAAVAGVTALDVFCGQNLSRSPNGNTSSRAHVVRSVIIDRSPEEVYARWHDFEKFPEFMQHIQSVRTIDGKRSHWVAKLAGGAAPEWDAEIVDDEPNSRIAWRAVGDADIYNSGVVTFRKANGGRGTIVKVDFEFAPPGGAIGSKIGRLFGFVPEEQVGNDLRCFKQIMETGEVTKSDASIHTGMHAAHPPEGRVAA